MSRPRYEVAAVHEGRWLRQAQRLRYLSLADDLGARLPDLGIYEDRFDAHGVHLVVRDIEADEVAATCRLVTPDAAHLAGGYPIEEHFDLTLLHLLRGRLVEAGRTCVDAAHPFQAVMPLLWTALARFLIEHRYDYVIATASVGVADGGQLAASAFRWARERAESPEDLRVFPVRGLALDRLPGTAAAATPRLLKSYLNLGSWVCGEPALDVELDCAEMPLLLPLARMHTRYTRQFLAHAA